MNVHLTFAGLTETLDAKMDSLITSNMVPQFAGFIKGKGKKFLPTQRVNARLTVKIPFCDKASAQW